MIGIGYKLGALAVVLGIIYLGYRHYVGLLDDISILETNNTKLTLAFDLEKETVEEQKEAITEWRLATEEYQQRVQDLTIAANQAREESRRLHEIFGKHDLTRLARAKPGLIESRINAGTKRVFAVIECETATPGGCDADGNRQTPAEAEPATP